MPGKIISVPRAVNEPVKKYRPGSPEREEIKKSLEEVYSDEPEIPMYIGGSWIRSEKKIPVFPPHNRNHIIGHYCLGHSEHITMAIEAALKAREEWGRMEWRQRAAIFLKAASLLSGPYRAKINAATMAGQSKTVHQAEIDAACEVIDFLRFNVQYMEEIYARQPESSRNVWNQIEYRPLEGFIFALTPFNFTAIASNLPTAPAMMGNVVVWKPSRTQIYSARILMEVFIQAGLPEGVINMVYAPGPLMGETILNHPDFAGIHFTGSTEVFRDIWKTVGSNIHKYKTYPRLVGETGGKDFVIAHASADVPRLVTALTRGAFEYQGQKCSALSRAYIPNCLWKEVRSRLEADLKSIRMGPPEDFRNFMCAVIDESAFDRLAGFIDRANEDKQAEIIIGGGYDKSEGFYIEPTVIRVSDPNYITMAEELFGPVLSVFIYEDNQWEDTLELVDNTSPYALTGAVFATDRDAVVSASLRLRNAAGNFYINDKPTGAVVGRQPFGGARASGTNDKAGSYLNLLRWVSPRAIKENFDPPSDFRYPYMQAE